MKQDDKQQTRDPVEQAINTVLQAERDAEAAIDACRLEAREIVQAAQQREHRISARTDKRLAFCHMRCNNRIEKELKERRRADSLADRAAPAPETDHAVLATIVDAVARQLVGSGEAPGRDEPDA